MAFKIQTNIYPTPQTTHKKPQANLESDKKEPQTPQNPPKTEIPKKPLGNLNTQNINTSNSAFSSLYLPKEEWLKKEFGIDIQNDEALKEKIENLLNQKENPSNDFLEQLLTELKTQNL